MCGRAAQTYEAEKDVRGGPSKRNAPLLRRAVVAPPRAAPVVSLETTPVGTLLAHVPYWYYYRATRNQSECGGFEGGSLGSEMSPYYCMGTPIQ